MALGELAAAPLATFLVRKGLDRGTDDLVAFIGSRPGLGATYTCDRNRPMHSVTKTAKAHCDYAGYEQVAIASSFGCKVRESEILRSDMTGGVRRVDECVEDVAAIPWVPRSPVELMALRDDDSDLSRLTLFDYGRRSVRQLRVR